MCLIIVMYELNLFYVYICPRREARKAEGRRRAGTLILCSDELLFFKVSQICSLLRCYSFMYHLEGNVYIYIYR